MSGASQPSDLATAALAFNRTHLHGREREYVEQALDSGHLAARGRFSERCTDWLTERLGTRRALLTNSCTSALEIALMLAGVGPGDEVAMPSFTFASSAGAVARLGAVPVFVDVRADTLNLDEHLLEAAVTGRTRAIMPMHYAGVACDMAAVGAIAARHGLAVVEDAAQSIGASHRSRSLGAIGDAGCLSFHDTKNLSCGEGGALLVNRADWVQRAEVLLDSGTDRRRFERGEVDHYSWVDVGGSFHLSELAAAVLWGQLEQADRITRVRRELWQRYHERLAAVEHGGLARRPVVPAGCEHNGHGYHLLVADRRTRDALIAELAGAGVQATFHYIPLHLSPAGRAHGRIHGRLTVTEDVSGRIVRLPLWAGMAGDDVDRVSAAVEAALGAR